MAWFDDLNLPGAEVTGYFGFVHEDSTDTDEYPDIRLASGRVVFEATAPAVRVDGAWVGIAPVEAVIFEGSIVSGEEDLRPPRILSTEAETGVEGWGWVATVYIDGAALRPFRFLAPTTGVHLTGDALIPITGLPVEIIRGSDGDSAYDLAVAAGYTGTPEEWIASLKGEKGDGIGLASTELVERNLDDVREPGVFWQSYASRATTERGYPYPRAGHLTVTANGLDSQVSQYYKTFDPNANVRLSTRNHYGTEWDEWRDIQLGPAGDSGGGEDPTDTGDKLLRGTIPDGTNINTLTEPGFYSVPTVASGNTMVNWPTNRGGMLIVATNPETSATTQDVIAHVSSTAAPERYIRTKLTASTTSWSPWSTPEWVKGRIPAGTNVDTFRTMGAWLVPSKTEATGLPGTGVGILEVLFITSAGTSLQRFTERVANDKVKLWHRYTLLSGGWAGVAWSEIGAASETPAPGGSTRTADLQVSDHATRVEYAASRRGGSIGTGGKPVFMWRFDHWLVAFRDKILPILKEFDLPATLNVNYDNLSNEQNGGGSITWADVQDWNQYYGIEIANHGSTHTNAATMESIYHEVVEGRRNLEKAMPRVAVETWQEHGSAYLVAGDLDGDTGLDLGRSLEAFAESYAGRLVMAEHAVVEGKIGSFYPPLTGKPQIGQSHYSLDRDTAASSISTIEYAQSIKRGLTGYTHPGLMDQVNIGGSLYEATYREDGTVGLAHPAGSVTEFADEAALRAWATAEGHIVHMPTRDFRAVCEWLADERDAGRIMVMTAAGGGFADISHNRYENILIRDSWAGSGWTRSGTGGDYRAVSTGSAGTMSQGMLLFTRFGWAMGAAHELLVYARADVETTLTLSMEQLGNPSNWKSEKVHTVPGDGQLRPYRINITLPRDRAITQMTARVGGPNLTIEGEPILAAI